MKNPTYIAIANSPFLNFVQYPHSHPPTSIPTDPFVAVFLGLNGRSRLVWCVILPNDIIDLHTSSLGTLVQEGPCFVFYATRHQVYWGLTHNMVFDLYLDLKSHTRTNKDTPHAGINRLTHPHKYILTPLIMWLQQLSVLHWMQNIWVYMSQ